MALVIGGSARKICEIERSVKSVSSGVYCADDVSEGFDFVSARGAQLVFVAPSIAESEAFGFIARMKDAFPDVPVVVLCQKSEVATAVKYMRAGAHDYIDGELTAERLSPIVESVLGRSAKPSDHERMFCEACPPEVPIVGKSLGMVKAIETLKLVAESGCNPVLVLGETGTGKELAARAVHWWREGAMDNFVAVNCAALTANLLESELFGHVRGSFTGADRDKTGLFELAGEGTIFLDEISEMPVDLQAKLLRVLQERVFRKVGGTKDIQCKATIIASSNRDLLDEALRGNFRKDLYYRLAVFPVTLPPLASADRCCDVGLLAEYFLKNSQISCSDLISGFDGSAMVALQNHNWPGNVRELRNVIDRAIILTRSGTIGATSLMLETRGRQESVVQSQSSLSSQKVYVKVDPDDFSLETAEREFILRALRETGWQRTKAAALLGITRATLHSKLKRYSLIEPKGQFESDSPQGCAPFSRVSDSSANA